MLKGALPALLDHLAVVDGGFECVHGLCSGKSLLIFPILRSILPALALHDDVECGRGSYPGSCSEKGLLGSSMLMEEGGLLVDTFGQVECEHGSCPGSCSEKSLLGSSILMGRGDLGLQCGVAECGGHGSCSWKSLLGLRADVDGEAECGLGLCSWKILLGLHADVGGAAECGHGSCHRGCGS